MTDATSDFETFCAQHGVSPDSIPDRLASSKKALGHMAGVVAGDVAVLRKRKKLPPDVAERRKRRRTLGTSGVLPHEMRDDYTEGQQAVLAVIAREIGRRGGYCALFVSQIMERSGARRRLVPVHAKKGEAAGPSGRHGAPAARRQASVQRGEDAVARLAGLDKPPPEGSR